MMLDVSVVIPTFRRERQLLTAIISALAQAEVTLEVVVVDDSPEGSARAPVTGLREPRVRYVHRSVPSRGRPSLVRNDGAASARGRYLMFLDDDDVLCRGALAELAGALDRRPGAGFAYGTVLPFGSDLIELERECAYFQRAAQTLRAANDPRRLQAALLFGPSPLPTAACLVSREAFLALGGFDAELTLREDVELYARLARRFGGVFVDRPVFHYRIGAPSLMQPARAGAAASIAATYRVMHARYREDRGRKDFYALRLGDLVARLHARVTSRPGLGAASPAAQR